MCQEVVTCGHGASKDLGSHAVEMYPSFKLRRQMAAAAGKKSTTFLSLFMEAHGLDVEDKLSTVWAEGVWTGKWEHEQKRSMEEASSKG